MPQLLFGGRVDTLWQRMYAFMQTDHRLQLYYYTAVGAINGPGLRKLTPQDFELFSSLSGANWNCIFGHLEIHFPNSYTEILHKLLIDDKKWPKSIKENGNCSRIHKRRAVRKESGYNNNSLRKMKLTKSLIKILHLVFATFPSSS